MAHVISGIPRGATVYVFAQGRFRHTRFVSSTGAMTILSHEGHYPIKVAVRHAGFARDIWGNLSIGAADDQGRLPGEESRTQRSHGGDVDMLIASPDDWYYAGSPRLNTSRHATLISVAQIEHPSTPATDIYERMPVPAPPEDSGLCDGFTVTDSATLACNAPHLPGLTLCQEHAEAKGLVKPLAPPILAENACVWSACPKERFSPYVMCAEHAILAGLVGAAPVISNGHYEITPPEIVTPLIEVVSDLPPDPAKGRRGIHKPTCACRICTTRKKAALVHAGA